MAGGHIGEGEKQLCQMEVDGVCLTWMKIQLCALFSSIVEHFFSCHVVVIHHLLACQQKGL